MPDTDFDEIETRLGDLDGWLDANPLYKRHIHRLLASLIQSIEEAEHCKDEEAREEREALDV